MASEIRPTQAEVDTGAVAICPRCGHWECDCDLIALRYAAEDAEARCPRRE